ncbi:N-acylneuraminate cytidylyltransferase [Bacteroides faecichinchillae]|uniref:N-acylneuraminate cytidylyltransferase n=1 Tax=Bacteroides faecichinchillae TaxID=871325 RepID=A0A1M5B8I7_9BACE|nr:acylneuraminate cytidylyltransferase family protein [Bacteroides faecichinchillae]THG67522.1 acylneuraminate cytidylyltransferase family protein [Bacteroides faecichinchillae]SHF38871.1 N-acylneuraminate cytidylyltransferase [Bacteroides faecichinchillae]
MSKVLFIIPARGGSKGIPHKNIKELCGKPLITYSIDVARQIVSDENICVSTDDDEIIRMVESYGLSVGFKRPDYLSTDQAGTNGVLLHALDFYEKQGHFFDVLILLQPTSPFRKVIHLKEALALYDSSIDMVVSVKEAATNPYYNSFEEGKEGLLTVSKGDGKIERRQDAPKVWEFNGSIYVINPTSLKEKGLSGFTRIKKYEMDDIHSVDLDTMFDWKIAELMLKEKMVE